jgi:hypothetical protein
VSEFPSEYAKPMKPIKGVIWLWVIALSICGIGLLLPNFLFSGSSYSYRSGCISNQKQIMTSLAIYCSDFDDYFPPYFSFDGPEKLKAFLAADLPYLKNSDIYLCPVELSNVNEKKPSASSSEGLPGTMDYVHCLSLIGVIPEFSTGKRLLNSSTVRDPAKTPYMRDIIRGFDAKETQRFMSSHGSTFVISYVDTHVKAKKLDINENL